MKKDVVPSMIPQDCHIPTSELTKKEEIGLDWERIENRKSKTGDFGIIVNVKRIVRQISYEKKCMCVH